MSAAAKNPRATPQAARLQAATPQERIIVKKYLEIAAVAAVVGYVLLYAVGHSTSFAANVGIGTAAS